MRQVAELKRVMQAGQPVFALLHGLASPQVAEMAALAGYDVVVVDGEHGPGDSLVHQGILQAIAAGGAMSMLRVATNDAVRIGQALDGGSRMLLVPGIADADAARAVVDAALYPPVGRRGNGTLVARAAAYGLQARGYDRRANDDAFVAVMIESRAGAENAAAIAAVPGIDAIVVGVFDLSADLGITAQFEHPEFIAVMSRLEADVVASGKLLGTVLYPGTTVEGLVSRGHRLITLGADTLLLGRAMSDQLASARSASAS